LHERRGRANERVGNPFSFKQASKRVSG
jgi:hypothetical protein